MGFAVEGNLLDRQTISRQRAATVRERGADVNAP